MRVANKLFVESVRATVRVRSAYLEMPGRPMPIFVRRLERCANSFAKQISVYDRDCQHCRLVPAEKKTKRKAFKKWSILCFVFKKGNVSKPVSVVAL